LSAPHKQDAVRLSVICILLASILGPLMAAGGEEPPAGTHLLPSPRSPVGRWKTVDDASGKVKAIVNIWEDDSKIYGRIEQLLDPDPKYPNPRCVRCRGALRDHPVIGMRILWDLKEDRNQWSGGQVLDPDNGRSYRCTIAVEDGGRRLRVHGFVGFSLLGRTQYWLRVQ
jgi:uncharacterized protein (DUF2147 family)